jgi:hypothetical protein
MAIIGPSRDSRKSLFAGENPAGVRDSPLWGPWTRLAFTAGTSTATTGTWRSPTATTGLGAERRRAEGSAIGILAPFVVP